MILLRSHYVDDRLEAFAGTLETLSGLPVAYLLDERGGPLDPRGREKVGLTEDACAALNLYCPPDFAWRCGDYGFYLARARYPDVSHFWVIESDVRIAGKNPERFFRKFEHVDADLICGHLDTPIADWVWLKSTDSSDASAHMCFFPVVRLSASAIDLLLQKRQAHSRIWARRQLWPNDEAFVGTTLFAAAGCSMIDLNEGDPPVYRGEDFAFSPAFDGDLPLHSEAEVALFHPVLFGKALEQKRGKLDDRRRRKSLFGRIRRRIRWIATPNALARTINRRSPW